MKNNYLKKVSAKGLFISACALISINSAYGQFTNGNITVLQIGDGVATLTNTGNPIVLREYSPLGIPAYTLAIPTGSNALLNSGTATSEGALSLSANGNFLVFAGYNAAFPNGTAVASSASSLIARGVGMVNAAGSYSLAATSNTFFSGNNIRSATSNGTGNFWAAGANEGTNYFGNLNTPATIQNTLTNTRCISINTGSLYFSTGTGTPGIYAIPLGVTAGPAPVQVVNATATGTTASPYAFYTNPANTIMYIADDRSFANGGGIQKWINNGAWTYTYTIATGTVGARGVIANFANSIPIIYATTTESSANRLVAIADVGALSTATTVATSVTNTIFRGVAFSPSVSCVAPTVSVTSSISNTICSGQSVTLTASGATTYSWNTGAVTSSITVTPTVTTTYTATGTNSCSSANSSITQTVVICNGIKSLASTDLIKFYPNPANDVLNVSFDVQGKNYAVTIIDALGKVVFASTTDKNYSINTSNFTSGIYILKVKTANNEQSNYKFIKN